MGNRQHRSNPEQIFLDYQEQFKEVKLPSVCGELNERDMEFFKAYASDRNFNDWKQADLILLAEMAKNSTRKECFELLISPRQLNLHHDKEEPLISEKYQKEIDRLAKRNTKIYTTLRMGISTSDAKDLKRGIRKFDTEDAEDSLMFGDGAEVTPN